MKVEYKLNYKWLRDILKSNLLSIVFFLLLGPLYLKWRHSGEIAFDETFILIFFGVFIVFNLPSLLLFINYFSENKNTEFTIDYEAQTITINQNGVTRTYHKKDVKASNYHLGIYYKNVKDKAGRLPIFSSNFGYWDLTFKNGDRYYLTTLLHDFLLNAPMIKNTKYRFRVHPYIKKNDSKQAVDLKPEKEKSRTEKFVQQYQSKNKNELKEILDNRTSYQEDAVKAAEIVFRNKFSSNK